MIERLYVHNFRCFENLSIDLIGRPSALIIGKNGTGKSTLRHSFALFQRICRGTTRVRDLVGASDFGYDRTDVPMRFEIEVRLEGKPVKYAISFEFPENFREARVAEEILIADGEEIFARQKQQVDLKSGGSFNMDWHVVALPLINERPGEKLVQRLRAYFASMILIEPVPSLMSGFTEGEPAGLEPDASNFAGWLRDLLSRFPRAYGVMESYLKTVIPDFESFENVPRGENGMQLRVKFEQQQTARLFSPEFKQLSSGEKCFFLSALIHATNKVEPVFCMWDEPDNHLSLAEVSHFILHLRKLANQQNGQFIATSHHPEAIRSFSEDNTIVFSRKSHLEPTIVRILAELDIAGDRVEAIFHDEIP